MGSGADARRIEQLKREIAEEQAAEPMKANDRQVAGDHYKGTIQHWDWVISNNIPYMEGQITKYVYRWRKKNGLQDLLKARHFLDKLIESVECGLIEDPVNCPARKHERAMQAQYGLKKQVDNDPEEFDTMSRAHLASTI